MPFLKLVAFCIFISILVNGVYSAPKNQKVKDKSILDENLSDSQPGYGNGKYPGSSEETDKTQAIKNAMLNSDNLGNPTGDIDLNVKIHKMSKNEKKDFDLKEKEKEKLKKLHHHHHHSKQHKIQDQKPIAVADSINYNPEDNDQQDVEQFVLIPQTKVKSSTTTDNKKMLEKEKTKEKAHKGSSQSSTEVEDISIQFSNKNPKTSIQQPKQQPAKYAAPASQSQSQNIVILN